MSTDIEAAQPVNPFLANKVPARVNAGTVAIESERAIAEAQGKLVLARRFPRDRAAAFAAIMEACDRPGFADDALYSFDRGGSTVSGGSIRLAEEVARCWGNIEYGLRELSRRETESEMEAYAWDLETITITSQKFTVRHLRDRSSGTPVKLTQERDIYEIGANLGARRLRERIFALIPADVKRAAEQRCRDIVAAQTNGPALIKAFAELGVSIDMLDRRLGRPAESLLPDDLVDLRGIYKSIKSEGGKVEEWFPAPAAASEPPKDEAGKRRPAGLAAAIGQGKGSAGPAGATAASPAGTSPQAPAGAPVNEAGDF